MSLPISYNTPSAFKLLDQLGNRTNLHASLAATRFFSFQNLETRRNVSTEISRRLLIKRLLLCLHDVWQRCITRLVQTKINRDNGWKLHINGLKTTIDFTRHLGRTVSKLHLRGESRLAPVEQCRKHLAGLVGIVVNRLLAEENEVWLFSINHALQNLRNTKRLDGFVSLHQNCTVSTHGKCGAQRFLRLCRTDRNHDDFRDLACFLQTDRFFNRDLVKRVHRHLDVCKLNARTISLNTDLYVVIYNPLYCDKDFHPRLPLQ